jgi:alpha-beta hydrolase superfamily lysophospholipase
MSKTIILIHGAWVTPKCWDNFKGYFEKRGYTVLTPAWPGKERSVEEQQRSPDQILLKTGLKEVVEYYTKIVRTESEPPILIGHGFGGFIVQALLDRGLGKMGIAIDSAPPKGVFSLFPSAVWSLLYPLVIPFSWKKILTCPFEDFVYGLLNESFTREEQEKIYHDFAVPECCKIFWQAALSPLGDAMYINFKNKNRAPLLMIAGEKDHLVPAAMNKINFKKYTGNGTKTDFKEFPGRVHWLIAQKGWEEVAEYCEKWIGEQTV